eukprot:TRINITY_DN3276_c0_g2_i1.p2 TRINITY_DN3276_c0_g2~~TRINITY_DN3276_c0_g2_i1.p2  ORF type:complete len:165 (-),score=13.36 TRINITY_DN3276_c0_g2_i1:575-1069(-)
MSVAAYGVVNPLKFSGVGVRGRRCTEVSRTARASGLAARAVAQQNGSPPSTGVPTTSDGPSPRTLLRRQRAAERAERRLREDLLAAKPIGINEHGRPIYRRSQVGLAVNIPGEEYWSSGRRCMEIVGGLEKDTDTGAEEGGESKSPNEPPHRSGPLQSEQSIGV